MLGMKVYLHKKLLQLLNIRQLWWQLIYCSSSLLQACQDWTKSLGLQVWLLQFACLLLKSEHHCNFYTRNYKSRFMIVIIYTYKYSSRFNKSSLTETLNLPSVSLFTECHKINTRQRLQLCRVFLRHGTQQRCRYYLLTVPVPFLPRANTTLGKVFAEWRQKTLSKSFVECFSGFAKCHWHWANCFLSDC